MAIKQFLTSVTSTGVKADAEASMTVSTSSPDRDGDRIFPSGLNATAYLRNPALMWSHGGAEKYAAIPIGTVTAIETTSTGIRASWRWLADDPLADRVRNAWQQGVIRAASIGFKPIERTPNEHGGFDITKFELLEISLCAIPTNAEAVRALKALGLFGPDRFVRERSPSLAITGDRSIPRFRLREDDVVLRLVDDCDVYHVDTVALRASVHDVVLRALCEAAGKLVQDAIARARGNVN